MKTSVSSSIRKQDGLSYLRPVPQVKYTQGSLPELRSLLAWARTWYPELYREYVNADSGMFHNMGKRNHSDSKALKRMTDSMEKIQDLYKHSPQYAAVEAEKAMEAAA